MIKGIFYGWWIVLVCFLIGFYVGGTVWYGFSPFFEPIADEFGWSYTQISLATSFRGLEMGIFAPLMGFLVDRYGSRKLIFFGIITVGLGFVLLSFTQSLAMFYSSFLILAFGTSGCTSLVLAITVANWFNRDLGKALGITACGVGASGLIVPIIVWLICLYQWRATFIILGLGMWFLAIPLLFVIRNRPEEYGYLPDGKAPAKPIANAELENYAEEIGFKEVLTNRSFWFINIANALRMISVSAVIIHLMPYLNTIGIPRVNAGFVAAAIPLFSIGGRLGFGLLGDVLDKRYVMAMAFCITATGMLAFSFLQANWVIFLFLFLFPSGYGGGLVLSRAILREYFGRKHFGKIMGITMGTSSIASIIGPLLAGLAFDILGSYNIIWLVFCGMFSLAIVIILLIEPLEKVSK